MRLHQSNKVTMYGKLKSYLRKKIAVVNTIPKFTATLTRFETIVDAIFAKSNQKETVTSGKTEVKYSAEEDLRICAASVAASLFAYAVEKNNFELKKIAKVTERSLNRLKDLDLIDKCTALSEKAEPVIAELADFGLTPEQHAELMPKIAAFKESMNDRGSATSEQSVAGMSLDQLLHEADTLIEQLLNTFAEKFKFTNPEFYEGYLASKVINNVGVRHENGEEEEEEETQPETPPASKPEGQ